MFGKIESFFDKLLYRRMHAQREKVALIWRDKNGKILVDKTGMILMSEVWRHV